MKSSFPSLIASVLFVIPSVGFAGASLTPPGKGANLPQDIAQPQQVVVEVPNMTPETISETTSKVSQTINMEERQALWLIHVVNITDIKASLLAFEKDTTAEIKNLAARIIVERLASEVQLQNLAIKYGLNLDDEQAMVSLLPLNEASESLIEDLKEVPSLVFAQVFEERMSHSHANLSEDLQEREPSFQSSEIRDFVMKTIDDVEYLTLR